MKTKIGIGLIGVLVMLVFLIGCTAGKTLPAEQPTSGRTIAEPPKETPAEEVAEPAAEEVKTAATHTVKFVGNKFEPAELTVKVGDTVVWKNERDSPTLNKAMVLGTKTCAFVKSPLLQSGETFEWTFTEPGTCQIVDGYIASTFGKVIVEE